MNYLSQKANSIKPYTPGEQPQDKRYIKINTNENPYPMSPLAQKAAEAALCDAPLYPDPNATKLLAAVAKTEGVSPDQVFAANGSDELLAFCFQAFFNPDKPVFFPDITYSFYPVYANLFNIPYEEIPLNEQFQIDITDYKKPNGGIIFPNPNAPTGVALSLKAIEELLSYNLDKAVVIIDEAYVAFGAQTAVPLVKTYPNLLVVRTMSKSHSMAGMRVGYAIGQPHLVQGLNIIKNSFNSYVVDRVAAAAAEASLLDTGYTKEVTKKIIRTRERVVKQLAELGYEVLPSLTNFIFIRNNAFTAQEQYDYLRENGVLVRYFNHPRVSRFIRVTIGTDSQMDEFIRLLKAYSLKNMGEQK